MCLTLLSIPKDLYQWSSSAGQKLPQTLALLTNIHFSFHDFSDPHTGIKPASDQDNQAQAACGQGEEASGFSLGHKQH